MTSVIESMRAALPALVGLAAIVTAQNAGATDVSAWSDDIRSSVRLVTGSVAGSVPKGTLSAGIEVKLQPGWKTYWRYPGDSGVPPQFSFKGSENLGSIEVLYPAPHAFTDESGTSIGYKENVIFPLRVTARDPGKPVTLHAQVEYAVCEKLCVPAQGKAELLLRSDAGKNEVLAAALARVPKRVPPDEISLSAKRVTGKPKPLVYLDLAAPEGQPVEVFVEGPGKDWALPIPKPAQGAPSGRRHFGFEFDGLPPGTDPMGHYDLTFTVVTPDHAYETTTRLD